MKLLLVCKGEYRYFFPALAHALCKTQNCEVDAVVFSTPAAEMLERSGAFERVHNLAGFLRSRICRDPDACLARLRDLESAGDLPALNTILLADRILRSYSREDSFRFLDAFWAFWSEILREFPPNAIVGEVAGAAEWMGWSAANRAGIPYLIPYPTPVANRTFFIHSPGGKWEAMERVFEAARWRELSCAEKEAADGFIREFRAASTKPPSLAWAQRSPFIPNFRQLFRRAARVPFRIRTFIRDGKFEVGSFHGTPPWRPVLEDALRIVRHAVSEAAVFSREIPEGSSVFFPLHVQPEFTTDVRAPFIANQIAVIEALARSVPIGWRVFVKEHPGMKGERRLSYYRDIRRLPNVVLLSPSVDSHELIRRSVVTVTITGSAAWEAILYGKAVIALGPLCYGFCDLVLKCEHLQDLSQALYAAREFEPDSQLLHRFVHAFLASAHEFQWGDPVRMPEVCCPENCEKIANAFRTDVEETPDQELSPSLP